MITLNSSGSATTSSGVEHDEDEEDDDLAPVGRGRTAAIRGMVPGASLRLATSPSRVSDRMAAHGPWDIDTGASCNSCYTCCVQRWPGAAASLRRYVGPPTAALSADRRGQNALIPVRARPMSSFWIWLVPS